MSNKEIAIKITNASKAYKMYQSPFQQLLDVCFPKKRTKGTLFHALKDISLTVYKGERVGLIGRNGSGKTTTLKLITRNFVPTSGSVEVHGEVQALMQTGLGFHPEFTGLANIKASLIYNGLNEQELQAAIEDIIDFVELGDFLNQPLKTYSAGMQSRLLFATATAISPDILIIDEVLGAGDAYFSAKSAERMRKLTDSGCTLILVSHSVAQIMQFCDKAIWLEAGDKVMEGDVLDIVKAYEEFTMRLTNEASKQEMKNTPHRSIIQTKWLREKLLREVFKHTAEEKEINENEEQAESSTETGEGSDDGTVSMRGVSRYPIQEKGLVISNVRVLNTNNEVTSYVHTGQGVILEIEVEAEKPGNYDCSFSVVVYTIDGRWVLRDCSDVVTLNFQRENLKKVARLEFKHILLGNGRYTFSAGIYKILNLNRISTARYYDVLSRSFDFKVQAPYIDESSLIYHPSCWLIEDKIIESMHEHDMVEPINGRLGASE